MVMRPLLSLFLCCAVIAIGHGATSLASQADLHAQVAPAVVGLTCEAPWPGGQGRGSFYGTGVLVSADGLVLTNITVVPKGADDIRVTLTDGRIRPARLLRVHAASEGVLVRVDGADLPYLPLADGDRLELGDPVAAFGNPNFSIQRDGMVTMRTGIVSGRYHLHSVDDQSRYVGPVIESDAMVNGGSDGGPLVDADGNLVGILSLAYAADRWLGTAIPIEILRAGLPELAALPTNPPPLPSRIIERFPGSAMVKSVAQDAGPATVAIAHARRARDLPMVLPEQGDERPVNSRDGQALQAAERKHPAGARWAGVVISPEGLVLTAANLLPERLGAVRVYLADGTSREATLLGRSPADDVALLQLTGAGPNERFDHLPLSDHPNPSIGASVVILGRSQTPGRLTANLGRISALQRFDGHAWQHSAAVNYGNLGGPMLDAYGRLIGIATRLGPNTAWRQNAGVGFAATADRLREILPLLERGETPAQPERAFVGFQPAAFDGEPGVGVAAVLPGTPAAGAGLEAGDRIVTFAGEAVTSWYHLLELIAEHKPGDQVALEVTRGSERKRLSLVLARRGDS